MSSSRAKTVLLPDIGEIETPSNAEAWLGLVGTIATRVLTVLPTEQDHWWFLVEQFDRATSYCDVARTIMQTSPITLSEIEYDGRRSEDSYVGIPNPGVVFLQRAGNALATGFNTDLSQIVLANVYVSYVTACQVALNDIRLKYAVHFHNNCISTRSFGYADQWREVIKALEETKSSGQDGLH